MEKAVRRWRKVIFDALKNVILQLWLDDGITIVTVCKTSNDQKIGKKRIRIFHSSKTKEKILHTHK